MIGERSGLVSDFLFGSLTFSSMADSVVVFGKIRSSSFRSFKWFAPNPFSFSLVVPQAKRSHSIPDEQQAIRQARIKLYSHNAHLMVASVILQLAVSNDKDGYAAFALAKFQTAALALLHTFLDEMVAPGFSPCLF